MREIKFRVLDANSQMVFSDKHYTGYLGMFFEQMSPDGEDVMQYTGLKDRHGVEIYEGDILSSPSMPNSPVEFQRGSFNAVYADGSHDEWEAPLWRYSVEVIGNIYENPELLEQQ